MQESGASPAPAVPEGTFGARFLKALRKEGLPLSGFRYATIQELKRADRAEAIRILRRSVGTLSYAVIQQLKEEEPEEVARRMSLRAQIAAQQVQIAPQQFSLIWFFMT